MKDIYWATEPTSEIASTLQKKVELYRDYLISSGRISLWRAILDQYYKSANTGGSLYRSGEQREFVNLNVNHFRNLLLHLKSMTTQQRPAFEPRSTNTDYKSQSQTLLAKGLLEYYMREKRLENVIKTATEFALTAGEGFVICKWDSTKGKTYGVNPETNTEIHEGDLVFRNIHPLDLARDVTKTSWSSHDWVIVTDYQNRWTLAATYPDQRDEILRAPSRNEENNRQWLIGERNWQNMESDDIATFTFYHKRTAVMPEGRIVKFVGDAVLIDAPLRYDGIPIYRIAVEDQITSAFGYSIAYDILPIQMAADSLYSIATTNQTTFGVQNVLVPEGSTLTVEEVSTGLNLIRYNAQLGEVKSLNLTTTPQEIFNFLAMLVKDMETISGVNSVARGNPEASLKSGAALALVQAMAVQFANNFQQSYAMLIEDLGTGIINVLKWFADVPRVAEISGKTNRPLMKEFKGADLNGISRVLVDMGNPMARTTAGKINLGDIMLERGLIKTPEQYLMVIETGKLEAMTEGDTSQLMLIRTENEDLAEGKGASAVVTDSHRLHIQEHATVLANPEIRRNNPEIIKLVTEHIQEHLDLLQTANPTLLAILKEPAVPQSIPQNAGGVGEQQPIENPGQVVDATNPLTAEAAEVNGPKMPTNPLAPLAIQ